LLKIFKLIPRRTAIIHLAWAGALLLLSAVAIVPLQRSAAGIDRRIKEVRGQIETQKTLQPLYQSLKAKGQTAPAVVLPLPKAGKLPRDRVGRVAATLGGIARKASLETISLSPDPNALVNQSRSLLVNVVLRGDFMNFRRFLIGIGELDYLERIEEVVIQQEVDYMEFRMKIWLALG
jgi:hypothetical protein